MGDHHGLAVASLTCGAVGAACYPLAGLGFSGPVAAVVMLLAPVLAIITGAMANHRSRRATGTREGLAIAGLTLGVIELVLLAAGFLLLMYLFSNWDDSLRATSVLRNVRGS